MSEEVNISMDAETDEDTGMTTINIRTDSLHIGIEFGDEQGVDDLTAVAHEFPQLLAELAAAKPR